MICNQPFLWSKFNFNGTQQIMTHYYCKSTYRFEMVYIFTVALNLILSHDQDIIHV